MRSLYRAFLSTVLYFLVGSAFAAGYKPLTYSPTVTPAIKITSPKHESHFHNRASITVTVEVTPVLEAEDKITFLVDGQAAAEAGQNTSITLPVLDRGSHTIQAQLTLADGTTASSEPITVFQHQASALFRKGQK